MVELVHLFQPGRIGTMQLKNRVIMAPMATMYGNADGTISERLCRYYEERAKSEVGLIIVENIAIAPEGKIHPREPRIYGDEFIPGLKRLADCIHRYDIKVALQLRHAGRQTTPEGAGVQPVAPSPIPCPMRKLMPRELATEEVKDLVEAFAEGARRAKEAGFDAVEIQGAHGYLICEFLSAYSNIRTDKYGGNLENRMRFALEIISRTKEKVGTDFPLIFRLSGQEFVAHGLTLDETRLIARRLQEAGIHCLDISAGNYEAGHMIVQPAWLPRGCLVPLAEQIKKVVTIPVSVAGRINDPTLANSIIGEGKVDFVSIGRPLLADPEWARKAKEGRLDDIRMCIACCHCMDSVVAEDQAVTCAVNPTLGKEDLIPLPARKSKRVLIIGAGPAGMEAAGVAALRGHKVTVYEKEQNLGGQLIAAAIPPGKEELRTTIKFLEVQLSKLGVEVRRGEKASFDTVTELKPDVVVIATGSTVELPDIPGANLPNVAMARDVIMGRKTVRQRVVVIGGGRAGCETAELLANQGKDVTLVRMTGKGRLASEIGPLTRKNYLRKLRQSPIVIEAESPTERITPEGVIIKKNGQSILVKAESVVLSPMPTPNRQLAEQLKDRVPELHIIGDSVAPRGIKEAIHEGFEIGCKI